MMSARRLIAAGSVVWATQVGADPACGDDGVLRFCPSVGPWAVADEVADADMGPGGRVWIAGDDVLFVTPRADLIDYGLTDTVESHAQTLSDLLQSAGLEPDGYWRSFPEPATAMTAGIEEPRAVRLFTLITLGATPYLIGSIHPPAADVTSLWQMHRDAVAAMELSQ